MTWGIAATLSLALGEVDDVLMDGDESTTDGSDRRWPFLVPYFVDASLGNEIVG